MAHYLNVLMAFIVIFYNWTIVSSNEDRIEKIGNAIRASLSGVDEPGTIFLLNDVILKEGVVFGFVAYFRSDKPIGLQIWRPVDNTGSNFQLVWQMNVIPSLVTQAEVIYVRGKLIKDCKRVQHGDRLGIAFLQSPGAVAYTFDGTTQGSLGHVPGRGVSQVINNNTVVYFDNFIFPYVFSLAAYIDTDLSQYGSMDLVPCPNLTIPEGGADVVSPLPGVLSQTGPTGPTGETGPAGPPGQQGPRGPPGVVRNSSVSESSISNRSVGILFLIWLILLTILIIILLIYVCWCLDKKRRIKFCFAQRPGNDTDRELVVEGMDNQGFIRQNSDTKTPSDKLRKRGAALRQYFVRDKKSQGEPFGLNVGLDPLPSVSGAGKTHGTHVSAESRISPSNSKSIGDASEKGTTRPGRQVIEIGGDNMGHYRVYGDLCKSSEFRQRFSGEPEFQTSHNGLVPRNTKRDKAPKPWYLDEAGNLQATDEMKNSGGSLSATCQTSNHGESASSPDDSLHGDSSWLDQMKPEDSQEYSVETMTTEPPGKITGMELFESHFRQVKEAGYNEMEVV